MDLAAYYKSLILLPAIINAPGRYITRAGETVMIERIDGAGLYRCRGQYITTGQIDAWHSSGRVFASVESELDIISKA